MHFCVGDFILDVFQNAVEAKASKIKVEIIESPESFQVKIQDNGPGMTEAVLKNALDPFFTDGKKHKTRKVGLGLPFLKQAIDQVQGSFEIDSQPGFGTTVSFGFNKNHVDCPPIGNMVAVLNGLFSFTGDYDLELKRVNVAVSYSLVKSELRDKSLLDIRRMIKEFEKGADHGKVNA